MPFVCSSSSHHSQGMYVFDRDMGGEGNSETAGLGSYCSWWFSDLNYRPWAPSLRMSIAPNRLCNLANAATATKSQDKETSSRCSCSVPLALLQLLLWKSDPSAQPFTRSWDYVDVPRPSLFRAAHVCGFFGIWGRCLSEMGILRSLASWYWEHHMSALVREG